MRAVIFPGQGAQRIGMGEDLFDRYPKLLAQADDLLGFSLRTLCLEDAPRLNATRYTQPALFVVCYLSYLDYEAEHGTPAIIAGHSVGEFAALAAANALGFADALKLVNARACTMATISGGAMAAVVGPGKQEVMTLISDFGSRGMEIANENSPTQTVVAGLMDDVQDFVEFCKKQQVRAVRLNVSGAFHSTHMRPAAHHFASELEACTFATPRIPIVSNVTARLHASDNVPDIKRAMAMHLYSPVLWSQSIDFMLDLGITGFTEIGPRSVLTPMTEEIKMARRRNTIPALQPLPNPSSERLSVAAFPVCMVPDGQRPEFASASALAAPAACTELLECISALYHTPLHEPGRMHQHVQDIMIRLAQTKLPCTIAFPALNASARENRRYLRQLMQVIFQAALQMYPITPSLPHSLPSLFN